MKRSEIIQIIYQNASIDLNDCEAILYALEDQGIKLSWKVPIGKAMNYSEDDSEYNIRQVWVSEYEEE